MFQSSLIGVISCYFVALFVNTDHFGSLFGVREALDTTVPMATMELKKQFRFLDGSHQIFHLQRAVYPRDHICGGECECHSVVIHTLANKTL